MAPQAVAKTEEDALPEAPGPEGTTKLASPAASTSTSTSTAPPVLEKEEALKEKVSVEVRLWELAEREKAAEEVRKEAEAALKTAKEADLKIHNSAWCTHQKERPSAGGGKSST